MSNYYVLQGPHETRGEARFVVGVMANNDGWDPDRLRVIRLRPKGLAARVAALEAALAALETEHAALVQRVSDLENLPASPADASAEVGSAEPGEPTDDELLGKAQAIWNNTGGLDKSLRAGRALYNLGREHGNRDRAALLARAERAERETEEAEAASLDYVRSAQAATPARDPLRDPRWGDWFVDGDDGTVTEVTVRQHTSHEVVRYHPNGERKRDGTRPTANKAQPTEAEMAAELEAAGWYVLREASSAPRPERWTNATGKAAPMPLRDAYAAMRAGKVVT